MTDTELINNVMNRLEIYTKASRKVEIRSIEPEKSMQLLNERKSFKPKDTHVYWQIAPFPKISSQFYKSYIEGLVSEIAKLDHGKALLNSFISRIPEIEKLPIIFSSDPDDITAFNISNGTIGPESKPHIILNMWDGKRVTTTKDGKVYAYTISGLLKPRILEDEIYGKLVEVSAGLTPFYITFAHELIHASKESLDRINNKKRIPYMEQDRKRVKNLYPDDEERKTVLSVNNNSELILKKEAGEMIRYPYHFDDMVFYEPIKSIMHNIFFDAKVETQESEEEIKKYILSKEKNVDLSSSSESTDMPEQIRKGVVYTQLRILPSIYRKFYKEADIVSKINNDFSAYHLLQQERNKNKDKVIPLPSPQLSIIKERIERPEILAQALNQVEQNSITEQEAMIRGYERGNHLKYLWTAKSFTKVRKQNLPFSPSSRSSSSSDMPLPSITAKTENIKKELARKLARAVYTKIMLEHNYIGEKSNNIYKPSAYAVTEGIRRLTQNLKQISTSTVKPMSLEQFKKLMHFYSNNDAIEHRRKMVNVVTKWYLKYGHSLFPKT